MNESAETRTAMEAILAELAAGSVRYKQRIAEASAALLKLYNVGYAELHNVLRDAQYHRELVRLDEAISRAIPTGDVSAVQESWQRYAAALPQTVRAVGDAWIAEFTRAYEEIRALCEEWNRFSVAASERMERLVEDLRGKCAARQGQSGS